MKAVLLATALFVLPYTVSAQGANPAPVIKQSVPQQSKPIKRESSSEGCDDLRKAEAKLTETYQQITKYYSYDPLFLKYFEASQQAWLAYRQAELNAIFPPEYRASYGTVHQTCGCLKLTELTNARIKAINLWVKGADNTDVCMGTARGIKK